MSPLLNLCDELLHEVLLLVKNTDLGKLAITCKTLNTYIKGNTLLWKATCLRDFDFPPNPESFQWESELKKFARVQTILESSDMQFKRDNLALVVHTTSYILDRANKSQKDSQSVQLLAQYFENTANRDAFIFASGLFGKNYLGEKKAGSNEQMAAPTHEERQLSAKLHTYYGTSHEAMGRTRSKASHPYARSKVYDLRNYNAMNAWGPYLNDFSFNVDWEKVEAIMIDLGYNLYIYRNRVADRREADVNTIYNTPFDGITPGSYRPVAKGVCPIVEASLEGNRLRVSQVDLKVLKSQPNPPLEARDPYGVTGLWRRIVCFLDYNDLYAFNFLNIPCSKHSGIHPDEMEPREPITTPEAIRLITMRMEITRIEEPSENDGQEHPVVHFKGMSRSMHASWDPNANSKLLGSVRMTKNGDVRWTTLSIFHGEARWRSESVQLGGLRSGRGVIGTWFDKDYDPNGPAGPTAFWKICDEEDGELWEDSDSDWEDAD